MINEANIMSTLFGKVKTFVKYAKKSKTEEEKEELVNYGNNLKKEIQNSGINTGFTKRLVSILAMSMAMLNTNVEAGSLFDLERIVSKIDSGIEQASNEINSLANKVISATNPDKKSGVVAQGFLMDGNRFLEYADGGRLVYRADLGNKDKTTYFAPGSNYKGVTWDEAIDETHPITESVENKYSIMLNEAASLDDLLNKVKKVMKKFTLRVEDGDESVKSDIESFEDEVKSNKKIPGVMKKIIMGATVALMAGHAMAADPASVYDDMNRQIEHAEQMYGDNFGSVTSVENQSDNYAEKLAAVIDQDGNHDISVKYKKEVHNDDGNTLVFKLSDNSGLTIDQSNNITFFNSHGAIEKTYSGSESSQLVKLAKAKVK